MKVPLKRHTKGSSKLHRRLSAIKWSLLPITTAMFFLSMYLSSCGCDQQGNCDFSLSPTPPGSSIQSPPLPTGPSTLPSTDPSTLVGNVPTVPPIQPLTQVQVPTIPALVAAASPAADASSDSGSGSGNGGGNGGGGKTAKVTIKKGAPTASDPSGFVFVPADLKIQKGTTVTWSNPTNRNHTVSADDQSFDSGDFGQGKTFSQTFNKSGVTITYKCKDHQGQIGTITVS